jgi:hypothetical protein
MPVIAFAQALNETAGLRRHLLLGNGFSIALFPNRFRYGSLFEEIDFTQAPVLRQVFAELATQDFEVAIKALREASRVSPLYGASAEVGAQMLEHAELLKDLLVRAIAGRHPARPSDITEEQYRACRQFLAHFVGDTRVSPTGRDIKGRIYTVNYDLLLYWVVLHDELVVRDPEDPFGIRFEETEHLEHDDGFRAPVDDPNAPYVTWEAEGGADSQNIHFLHGGLHLYDYGAELQKKCWERAGGIPLVDQIREALAANKFPLFVAEGSSEGKLNKIRHSGYLQRSLKSFASICRTDSALFIFGHSLAENDEHILSFIERGKVGKVYIGLHGDPGSNSNRAIAARAERFRATRNERHPLDVKFFSSDSASVWG